MRVNMKTIDANRVNIRCENLVHVGFLMKHILESVEHWLITWYNIVLDHNINIVLDHVFDNGF